MLLDEYYSDDNVSDIEENLIYKEKQHKRKILTYKRAVNSIDASLDEKNYDKVLLPNKVVEIIGELPDKSSKKKNAKRKVTFVNQPQIDVGRQRLRDIIRNKPGVDKSAKHAKTPLEAFHLFFTVDMVQSVVLNTNRRIENTLSQIPNKVDSSKYPYFKVTDAVEVHAFLGLLYYRGLYGMNCHHTDYIFGTTFGPPVFSATMSCSRFKFLLVHISFDDHTTRQDRWKSDRFSAMREIFEQCNTNFAKAVVPDDYLSLDETLYPTRNQISFKQYNPDKPAKYGLLFKSINSARFAYTYQTHVYCGKPEGEPDNTYYVTGTAEYVKMLVQNLAREQDLAGRNISMDRLYSSFYIANWLLEKNITMVGTMQQNRVGIPPKIKDIASREILSSETYWEKDGSTNISSYVVKTSKGKKNVLMLATIEPIIAVTKDDGKKKPAIYKLYDFTKGGTDIVDQKMGTYTVKSKSRKWTTAAFAYLLDTIRVNSQTVYALNNNIKQNKTR